MFSDDIIILGTRTMLDYARDVAYHIETFPEFQSRVSLRDLVSGLKVAKFADGEMEVEVKTSLRGKIVYLFANNAMRNTNQYSVEENKLELYHTIDALKRARARKIVLFEPYCSCSRSDRVTRKNSVGFWVHYKTLVSLGVDHILTYQLHSDQSKTVVDPTRCFIDDIPVYQLLEEYITDRHIRNNYDAFKNGRFRWVFCSVDSGGENLAKRFSQDFGCPLMIAHKTRDKHAQNSVLSTTLLTDEDINNTSIWIIDDMLDTGGSVYNLCRELITRNIQEINIVVTHPVFSHPCIERMNELAQNSYLKQVIVVDTINCDMLKKSLPFLSVISSSRKSAEIVMRMHENQSLSPFFEGFSLTNYLSRPKLF